MTTEVHVKAVWHLKVALNVLSLWMKSYSMNIQIKLIKQYFPVDLFNVLYKMVPSAESVH